MKELPLLRDISDPQERETTLILKLKSCETICNFSSPPLDFARREAKRKTLVEILDYLSSTESVFTPCLYEPLISTISVNLFRTLPVSSCVDPVGDPDDDVPRLEPAWPHIELVYEILRRLIGSSDTDIKLIRSHLTPSFIKSLLELFKSDDPREREHLKIIIHRIYGKVMPLRSLIRKTIRDLFYVFVHESQHHNGIAELLEILGSIINGFALPLKPEHKFFLQKSLMPLHTPNQLRFYHVQLTFCVTQFVEKDPSLAVDVIHYLLRWWPTAHSRKEVMFLNELEEILELTRPEEFNTVLLELWTRVAKCISSPHFMVAERALLFWNNEFVVNYIMHFRDQVMPLVYGSLKKSGDNHWNPHVSNLSRSVCALLLEMDEALYHKCERMHAQESLEKSPPNAKRYLRWKRLQSLAMNHDVSKDAQ